MARILLVLTDVGVQLNNCMPTNNTIEELCGVYKALEKQGHEVTMAVNDGFDGAPEYRTVEREKIKEEDYNYFDEVVINREVPNFFGGEFNKYNLWTINFLIRFNGRVTLFFCDPEMAKGNYLEYTNKKVYGDKSDIKLLGKSLSFDENNAIVNKKLLDESLGKTDVRNMYIRTAYPIIDHPIHERFKDSQGIEFVDSWREHLFNIRLKNAPVKLFETDHSDLKGSACYIGTNKPSRHRRLKELGLFCVEAEERGEVEFIGNIATFKNVKAKNRVNLDTVTARYEDHVASLVIGNRYQNDTGINHRYLQGLTIRRGILVDSTCDKDRKYLFDKSLGDDIYFDDREGFLTQLEKLRNESEFERIVSRLEVEKELNLKETAEEFVRRVNA